MNRTFKKIALMAIVTVAGIQNVSGTRKSTSACKDGCKQPRFFCDFKKNRKPNRKSETSIQGPQKFIQKFINNEISIQDLQKSINSKISIQNPQKLIQKFINIANTVNRLTPIINQMAQQLLLKNNDVTTGNEMLMVKLDKKNNVITARALKDKLLIASN